MKSQRREFLSEILVQLGLVALLTLIITLSNLGHPFAKPPVADQPAPQPDHRLATGW